MLEGKKNCLVGLVSYMPESLKEEHTFGAKWNPMLS